MAPAPVALQKLRERALARNGDLPLALLLEHIVPVERLRELATDFGVTPNGGFRIERAPARILAPKLAEERDPERLERVLGALLEPPTPADPPDRAGPVDAGPAAQEARALLALRDQEVRQLREELERAREGLVRARDRERDLERQATRAREELARAQRAAAEAEQSRAPVAPDAAPDKALLHRLRALESEREGLLAADEAMRRQLARDRSRTRELEEEVAELESLIPASRRRKKNPLPPAPPEERRFVVPYLQPSFYKSLESKERRAVEQAWQALLLFCTEGHSYPGLEVKQLGGQDTWSLRASRGLRVYFRQRADGDVDVLELGDREDQHTTLRRLKEKG
jgi:hypothetical protein